MSNNLDKIYTPPILEETEFARYVEFCDFIAWENEYRKKFGELERKDITTDTDRGIFEGWYWNGKPLIRVKDKNSIKEFETTYENTL
jgi:hypothetical protein